MAEAHQAAGETAAGRPGGWLRPGAWLARARASRASWSLALLSLAAAVVGAALVSVRDDATAHSRVYTATPQFKVWAALIISIVAALPAVWRVGTDLLRSLGLDPGQVLRSWAVPAIAGIAAVVAIAVLAGEYARGSGSTYYDGTIRVAVVYAIAVTAALPAFAAIWACYRELGGRQWRVPQPDSQVARLLLVRQCLLSALTTAGLLVSAGVLATGAERQAALASPRYSAHYPSAYVLIWGLGFSGLLVVNFLPAFRRLTAAASLMIDTTLPLLSPGQGQWQQRLQERNDLAELLKVTSGARDVVTSGILVAGPLISSAFSLLLPGH